MHSRPRTIRRLLVVAFVVCLTAGALLSSSASALDINTEVSLQDGLVGTPYEFQFTAEEGCAPYNFSFLSGTLPPGLTISNSGKLSGTPTVAGTFTFWVQLTDGVPGGACHSPVPSQGEYTVIIAPQIVITAALPGAKVGAAFNAVVTATGGGSLRWQVTQGALPPGLSLNRDTGALTGAPSTVGTYPFTITVSDDKRKATHDYSFVVAVPLAVEQTTLPALEVGVAANGQIPSTGGIGPFVWAGASVPSGLTLDAATGKFTGTPTTAGSFTVTVDVTDVDGQSVHATVAGRVARHIAAARTSAPAARAGKRYRFLLTKTGGVAPLKWAVTGGSLPHGLFLDRSTGTVSGTPRTAGTFRATVKVTDKLGATATRVVRISVKKA